MSCVPVRDYITSRDVYKRFRRSVNKQILLNVDDLVKLILRSYSLIQKYNIRTVELYTILKGFIMVYGSNNLIRFIQNHEEWIIATLSVGVGLLIAV